MADEIFDKLRDSINRIDVNIARIAVAVEKMANIAEQRQKALTKCFWWVVTIVIIALIISFYQNEYILRKLVKALIYIDSNLSNISSNLIGIHR